MEVVKVDGQYYLDEGICGRRPVSGPTDKPRTDRESWWILLANVFDVDWKDLPEPSAWSRKDLAELFRTYKSVAMKDGAYRPEVVAAARRYLRQQTEVH